MSNEIKVRAKASDGNGRVRASLMNPQYRTWLESLEERESWTAAQIANYQLEQLKKVVRHSYENCPAYRSIFDREGIAPAGIQSLDDVEKVPFVTKENLRDRLEEFSCPWPGRKYVTTGGSTGIPFGFYWDDIAFSRELTSKAHQYHGIGWNEGDRPLVPGPAHPVSGVFQRFMSRSLKRHKRILHTTL